MPRWSSSQHKRLPSTRFLFLDGAKDVVEFFLGDFLITVHIKKVWQWPVPRRAHSYRDHVWPSLLGCEYPQIYEQLVTPSNIVLRSNASCTSENLILG